MDDKFIDGLRLITAEDVLQEHRPTTSHRLASARPPTAASSSRGQTSSEVTTLASYRPESAAFTFSFNRPKTGRIDGGSFQRGARAPPSAFRRSESRAPIDEEDELIPDLEDVRDEDLARSVASAPLFEVQKMTSLKELDDELLRSKPFSVVDDVNLRKLCRFLVPEKDLAEQDELWTWDRLHTEIISTPEYSHLVRFQRKESNLDIDIVSGKMP